VSFQIDNYFKKKDGLFYLYSHGSGCENKGHSKKINVKTSAAHTTKSEIKTFKAMVFVTLLSIKRWFESIIREGLRLNSL
jgi:hypothetical protein